jgi:hypothetical protein
MQEGLQTMQEKSRAKDICAKLPLWLRLLTALDSEMHFHKIYARSLPRKADDLVSWGKDSVDLLLGSTNLGHVARVEFALIKNIACILVESGSLIGKEEDIYEKLLWARGVEISRSFPPSLGSPTAAGPVMLPILDLCNHSPSSSIEWTRYLLVEGEEEHVCFRTTSQILKDTEICINYGKDKSNEQLLWNYGISLDDNIADTVTFNVSVNLDSEGKCKQMVDLFSSVGVKAEADGQKLSILSTILHPLQAARRQCMMTDPSTLRAIPILMMNDDEIKSIGSVLDKEGFNGFPVEADSIEMMCEIMEAKLEKLEVAENNIENHTYQTKEDGVDETHRRRLATLYRRGQCNILEEALQEMSSLLGTDGDSKE